MPIILKSGSLSLLEISGPVQAYNGTVLPFPQSSLDKNWDCAALKVVGQKPEDGDTIFR